jgi:PilZ domain
MDFRQERRAVERTSRRAGALVVMPGLRGVYSCRVRDLSIKGAGLQLPDEIALVPTDFKLSFDGLLHSFECRLIWRHLGFVGIEFKLW